MIHWFRSHHGAPYDSKLAVVAKRANVTRGHAAAVWWAVLDHASQQDPRGFVGNIDAEEIAAAFDYEEQTVLCIIEAMRLKALLIGEDEMLTGWDKRQVKREDDTATDRQRTRREGMSRTVTRRHAPVTQSHDREEKSREDTEKKDKGARAPEFTREFEDFWEAYPRKASKGQALKAYIAARKRGIETDTMLAGAKRYATDPKREDKFTKHAATWLNAECWLDESPKPQTIAKPNPDAELQRAAWIVNGRKTNMAKVDDDTIVKLIHMGLTDEARARAYGWVPSSEFVSVASNARRAG